MGRARPQIGVALIAGKRVRGLGIHRQGELTLRFVAFPIRTRGSIEIRSIRVEDFTAEVKSSSIGPVEGEGFVSYFLHLDADDFDRLTENSPPKG